MKIDENKKYAIVSANHIAIELDKLPAFMENAVIIERGYESGHGYRFSQLNACYTEAIIVDGEQIMTDTAIKRMEGNKE